MVSLRINNTEVRVPAETTILKAAQLVGADIPTLCFYESVPNHASCMVCAIKNKQTGAFLPSCEAKVQEGMDIDASSPEVMEFRKDALELLLSDHVGDCEAPCRISCPAFMDIPQMNRLIAKGDFLKALEIVKEEIALPMVLGYICSAPCEAACRRKPAGGSVFICMLKRIVAVEGEQKENVIEKKNKKVAVVGSGPAGLSAAYHLKKEGYDCEIFEKQTHAGGTLLTVSESQMPAHILHAEVELLVKSGVIFHLNQAANPSLLIKDFDAVIVATGENSLDTTIKIHDETWSTNIPGIFAGGSVVKPLKMAVRAVAQGKTAARAAMKYLQENTTTEKPFFNSKFGKLKEEELSEYLKESVGENRIEPTQGFIVGFTREEAIAEAKRCLRCDCRKSQTCRLRNLSAIYCADQKKYNYGERKTIRKFFQQEILVYEPEKCIKCGLCIEIAAKDTALTGMAYIGRGFEMSVQVPFNKSMQEALASSAHDCIAACPTGALSDYNGEDDILPQISRINADNHE